MKEGACQSLFLIPLLFFVFAPFIVFSVGALFSFSFVPSSIFLVVRVYFGFVSFHPLPSFTLFSHSLPPSSPSS